jgi:hypothetical protein
MPAERAHEDVQVQVDRPPTDYKRWARSHDKKVRISPVPQYHPASDGDKDPAFQPEPLKFLEYSSEQETTEPITEEPSHSILVEEPQGSIFSKLGHPDESLVPPNSPQSVVPTDQLFLEP